MTSRQCGPSPSKFAVLFRTVLQLLQQFRPTSDRNPNTADKGFSLKLASTLCTSTYYILQYIQYILHLLLHGS